MVLDYFNKVATEEKVRGMGLAQMKGDIIEEYKICLEANGWVGLLAAQFDKDTKKNWSKGRTLANARDTGELEDKANVGLVIAKPPEDGEDIMETSVNIVKLNAGKTGSIEMIFNKPRLTFAPVVMPKPGDYK